MPNETAQMKNPRKIPLLLFPGVLLASFMIGLSNWHFEAYLQIVGILMLLGAVYKTRAFFPGYRKTAAAGLAALFITLVGTVLPAVPWGEGFTVNAGSVPAASAVGVILSLLLIICKFFLFFWLFSGFSKIVQPLLETKFSKRLMNGVILMGIIYLIYLPGYFFPGSGWELVAIPVSVICLILVLARVYRLIKIVNQTDADMPVQKLGLWPPLLSVIAIAAAFGLLMMSLNIVNAPSPKNVPYNTADSSDAAAAGALRVSLLAMGFDKTVLADLPDSEVLRYQGVTNCQVFSGNKDGFDGGTLAYSFCFSSFPDGIKFRAVLYYAWTVLPKHCYSDRLFLCIPFSGADIKIPDDAAMNISGGVLSGPLSETVSAAPLDISPDFKPTNPNWPWDNYRTLRFRLYSGKENQRAYIAFDALRSTASRMMTFNVMYIHQNTLFNMPYQTSFAAGDYYFADPVTYTPGLNAIPFGVFTVNAQLKPVVADGLG